MDYVKPCIRENNQEYVILHIILDVGTNELSSELTPERIAKSVIDFDKNCQKKRTVSISGIVPRNDNFNNKATEVNKELSQMCKKEKLLFVGHSNINPKAHLNRSKLHLNRNGYEKLGKSYVSFIRNNYASLPVTSKKVYRDFDDSLTATEVNNELNDHTSNKDLKSLRIKNLTKIVVGHLNINSTRYKFDFLARQVQGNTDIHMISETKLDESFPPGQFLLDGYSVPFCSDRDGNGGGILLFIRKDIPSKLLLMNKNIEGFFVEINLRNKKKWLPSCSYNHKKALISNHLAELSKNIDLYLTKLSSTSFLKRF